MKEKVPKMPSMKHLPWSEEDARQQKWLNESETEEMFEGNEVVMLEKLDGANACLTKDKVYARSHSGEATGEQWDMLKKMHAEELSGKIPRETAVFGEWLYAKHSIKYDSLENYFVVFGIYSKHDQNWYSWDLVEWVTENHLPLPSAPVMKRGKWSEDEFKKSPEGTSEYGDTREGYVIRNAERFPFDKLDENMAKCVRENHIQTEELHWRKGGSIETNDLE